MKPENKIFTYGFILCCFGLLFSPGCKPDPEDMEPQIPSKPGRYELSMEVDGFPRWYTLVIPSGYDPAQQIPLVLAFHPGNANMSDFYNAFSGFLERAEEENWLVVFPNGWNTTDNRTGECLWNAVHCCGFPYLQDLDDVGFVEKLVEKMKTDYQIDEKRIYATGRSNGGMLVHRLGAELGDIFAAIAPFAASAGGQYNEDTEIEILDPAFSLPVLLMHGLNDASVKFNGGLSSNGIRDDISFAETTQIWLEANACNQAVVDTIVLDSDLGMTWILDFSDCTGETQVVAIAVENAGHQLPRISNSGFDGTNAIVEFFKAHSKN